LGTTLLFFCAGNTCRSPLAAAMAVDRLGKYGVDVVSAGLYACAGAPASAGSAAAAAARGLDLRAHVSRPLDFDALAGIDWVIGMTADQVSTFRGWYPDFKGRVGLMGLPGIDLSRTGDPWRGEDVPDPFAGTDSAYAAMAGQIERLLDSWESCFTEGGKN